MLKMDIIPGLNISAADSGLNEIGSTLDGKFKAGENGIVKILSPDDRKVDFIVFKNHTIAHVKSSLGYPAIYPVPDSKFSAPARAVLMDLDGTSVRSEHFWMWIIERTISRLMGYPAFSLEDEDEPYVSGHSVSEHLQYCIDKYCPELKVEQARLLYHEITETELDAIMKGGGRRDAFTPAPGLKGFLQEIKGRGVKIGLVTSGLYSKAWPEILSAFRTLDMGDPLEYYDAVITAGSALKRGQTGTLGELEPKPHPWLYAETARVGLGIDGEQMDRVIGIEDSSAGIVSIRLAGFEAIGIKGGNILKSGVSSLCKGMYDELTDSLDLILGN